MGYHDAMLLIGFLKSDQSLMEGSYMRYIYRYCAECFKRGHRTKYSDETDEA